MCSSLAAEVAAAKRSAAAAETALQLAHSAAADMKQQVATLSEAMQPLQLVEVRVTSQLTTPRHGDPRGHTSGCIMTCRGAHDNARNTTGKTG